MNNHLDQIHILVVEDDDEKYSKIEGFIETLPNFTRLRVQRAKTVVDAEEYFNDKPPDLLVLDISMNISAGSHGPLRGGHANLGGLDILEKLYLLDKEVDTIVVTAFDYFKAPGSRAGDFDLIGLDTINDKAAALIGERLLGCVRYGSEQWLEYFSALLIKATTK